MFQDGPQNPLIHLLKVCLIGTNQKYQNSIFCRLCLLLQINVPSKCEHCFEWDRLNGREKLSVNDMKVIIKKFQERGGLGQIQFSGGEPLQRFDDLIIAAKTAKKSTDFWVITSGYGLNKDKTEKLKRLDSLE